MLTFSEIELSSNKSQEFQDIFTIFKNEKGIQLIISFIKSSSTDFTVSNKIYIKILQIIIDKESNNLNSINLHLNINQNEDNFIDYFNLLIFSIEKFEKNSEILNCLLEIFKKLITIKKVKNLNSPELLDVIFKVLNDTTSNRIAANGLHILDLILKNSDYYELIRKKNPFNLIVRILKNFRTDNIVSFHACGFLSKVLEKDDVYNFLKIMKIKNAKSIDILNDLDIDTFLPEIKEILSSEDNENMLNSLKTNIIRVLILMSKDKNFLQLLKDINSLDIFIKLLKSDLEIILLKNSEIVINSCEEEVKENTKEIAEAKNYGLEKSKTNKINDLNNDLLTDISNIESKNEMNLLLFDQENNNFNQISVIENQLPEFFKLILSLLKSQDMIQIEQSEEPDNSSTTRQSLISRNSYIIKTGGEKYEQINNFYNSPLMQDVIWCMTKALTYFINDTDLIYDILDYLINRDKLITIQFISFNEFSDIQNLHVDLFSIYYDTKWIYNFFYRMINLLQEYKFFNTDKIHVIIKENLFIFENFISKENFLSEKKEIFTKNIFSMSLNLIFNLKKYEDNTFHDFYFFYLKIIENLNLFEENLLLLMAFINTIFCSIENHKFGESSEKIIILNSFLKKFIQNENNITEKSAKYILMRLNRLMDNKINSINLLFEDELINEFIILILNFITKNFSKKIKIDESFAKSTISVVNYVLTKEGNFLVSPFLHEDGLIYIIQLSLIGVYDYDFNRSFIGIIQSFYNNHYKEISLFFRNFLVLRKFISELKEVKFSKGLNEKIYFELLSLFKSIIKSCDFLEAIEDTLFLDHLLMECNEIYCFYIDHRNRLLEMITEILLILCKEKAILKNIINSSYPILLEKIIKNMLDSGQEDLNDKSFEMYIGILSAFFKNSEYSKLIYSNNSKTLEYIKIIILNFKISEKNLLKILNLFKIILQYENIENINDRILTIIFFRELTMKIPSEKFDLKNKIEECNLLIENPLQESSRRTFYDNNSKLLKELSDLVKSERKNAVRKLTKNSIFTNTDSTIEKDINFYNNSENFLTNSQKKSNLKITENSTLSYQFDKIINNLGNILDYLNEKPRKMSTENNIFNFPAQTYDFENEQLSDFIKLISIFAREEENIQKICDNEILDKLISIMENDLILIFTKDQTISLLDKLSEHDYFIQSFFKSGKSCEFLLKQFNKINLNFNNSEKSEFEKNYVNVVTKILSKLSNDQIFILNNSDYLSFNNIYCILNEIEFGKETVSNILIILNNIILFNNNKFNSKNPGINNSSINNSYSTDVDMTRFKSGSKNNVNSPIKKNLNPENFTGNNNNITYLEGNSINLSALLTKLWKKFPVDIRVLEKIMKIIENLYLDEIIIKEFIDLNLLNNINDVLSDLKIDSEGIGSVFELIDKLMFHRYFAAKIIEQKSLFNISHTIHMNIFNTLIVEKGISIFLKGSKTDKNFVTIMGFFGVNDFCIKILTKYMTTCHSHIIKNVSELILILISDESNLRFFAIGENMDIILKAFKLNIKTKEQVLISLKIVNFITTKDTEYSKHEISKTEKKENLIKKKRDSFYNKISNNIKISVSYDFTILIEIINEILCQYNEYYDIIMQLCELINNLFQLSSEIWLKKFLMDVIINNEDKYLNKQEYLEIFLQTLYLMVKSDNSIMDLDSQSILFFISKLMDSKLNFNLTIWIIKILKQISKIKNINSQSNMNEFLKILNVIIKTEDVHEDELIYYISLIISALCLNTNFYLEKSTQNYCIFLINSIARKDSSSVLQAKILEDMKNISVYFLIDEEYATKAIADGIGKLYEKNMENCNKKNLMNIFQIVSALCIKSEGLKHAFAEIKFNLKLKELIEKDVLQDTMLEYQAKGCLVNLKVKKLVEEFETLKKSSTLRNLNIEIAETEINENLADYLKEERQIKLYTEKGEIKSRLISMNDNLDSISAFTKKKGKMELSQYMTIHEMESCVRSCTTIAFSKSKGLFTKKPKPGRCFSILGIKSLSGQKTFNVECENEEECIKYVDYITILIQNHKISFDSMQNKPCSSNTVRTAKIPKI